MKAVRFGFFLVRAGTHMDPNKWMIFAYDRVPAHRGPYPPPLPPIRKNLMLPNPYPPSRHRGTGIKAV